METLWGLRGHPFPGRRTVGAGHARPGGWREHPSMVRSVGRGLDPSASGCPGDGCWRKVSRGVGDAAPYGLPGNGRQREPAPHPALRGHLPPRGKARAVIPPGVLAAMEGRGGVGAPRPTDGDMETLWGLRGHPFPGRRTVGAGHARPGGWREHPSMVRSVGRGLDPSAGDCPGDGRWREVSRGVGDAAPYGLPGNGRQGGACPSSGPAGPPSPEGEGKGCMAAAQGFAGRRGRRPLRFVRERAAAGGRPSSGPAGPPSPEGEGKGCCWRQGTPAPTPAAGPRCGAGGSGCSTSGLTKPALYRRNLGRCRGGSRR